MDARRDVNFVPKGHADCSPDPQGKERGQAPQRSTAEIDKVMEALEPLLEQALSRNRSLAISPEDLEDCRCVILARVWDRAVVREHLASSREAQLLAWLQRCVRNELLNARRAKGKEVSLEDLPRETLPLTDDPSEAIERRVRILAFLQTLSPHHAELIWLTYGEGLTPAEMAAHLGKSPEAIKKTLSRVRKAARDGCGPKSF